MEQKERIIGFDFARGLAIIGMVFVNFKIVMSAEDDTFLFHLVHILSGKAAALFVVLAGVGMSLMYNSARQKKDAAKMRQIKISLLKRATFLFAIGLMYYFIWPADILHYYGLYLSIGVLFLSASKRVLLLTSGLLITGYFILMLFFDYSQGWDFETLEYTNFFTPLGFIRNLFINGFHPVAPWLAFLLIGNWLGRIDFTDNKRRKRITLVSLFVFVFFKCISMLLLSNTGNLSPQDIEIKHYLFSTEPMPPMFFYMVTASSLAIFIISISIWLCQRFPSTLFVKQMANTGQLALSNYFFHVIIGMIGLYLFVEDVEHALTIKFVFYYALFFNLALVVFSHLWRKNHKRGPLEWLMRKITG